jgi:serine/threonine protein kinase
MSEEDHLPPIMKIKDPDHPPQLNKIKKRVLVLSPTVQAGLEREAVMQDFSKDNREIGKGGFGSVWKVLHKATQKIWCVKVIAKQGIIDQKLVGQMNREIEIMYLLNHPHCLRLKNHFEDDENFYLVMPLAAKGQLYRILRKARKFDERTTAQILRETISALQYLHSFDPPIIHRDLKPENLLLNENGRIYLADFGWSNFKNDGDIRKTFCGTPEYIAPEMLKKEGHDHRIDIWSIGVLMFELLAGYSPFSAKSNQDLYQNIRKLKIHWPADMPPLAKNLISKILKLDPKERLSLDEILKHKWFQQTPIIKPLLENEYKNNKDLLMFHMLNKVTPDIELRINNLLGMEGITTTPGTDTQVNPEQAKKKSIMKQIQEKGASTHSTNNSIDMTKEQTDNLKMENAKLTKEINNLRTKINTMESELRGVKTENTKLKEVNTSSLQEQIQKLTSDLDRYKIMDKERLAVISELEEKNNSLRELNAKIQMLENDKEQQNKDFDNLKNKIKELNKQIEMKEMTTDYLNKKIDQITQEKEQLFCDYQKKIEVLQMKVLSNASEGDNENSLTGVIELLNESVGEMKSMFQKKFDIFIENFNEFKREYNNRDEKFTSILNEKSMLILEQIQKFSSTVVSDVQNAFKKVNTPNKEVKDQKTEWLNKQITELSGYKKKGLEYERKIAELTNQLATMTTNYNTSEEKVKTLEKQIELLGKGK